MYTAPIAASASGANAIVAAPASNLKIRVYAWALSFSGSVNAYWESGSTQVTGLTYGAAGAQAVSPALPPKGDPRTAGPSQQFDCAPGQALNLNLSGATAVGGHVVYDTVPQNL